MGFAFGNFRIGISHSEERGKGIGTWATEVTRDFAFEKLKLHRLELEVYSFNPRAERAYLKAGFRKEGVRGVLESAWGGFNSSIGAKSEYTLKLDPDDTEIYIYRGDGGYELVLQKNAESGEWGSELLK